MAQLPADGGKVLTWPNVTLLPFLADPTRFMVLKPSSTESMAARMNFDLRYQTVPNWSTYEAMQQDERRSCCNGCSCSARRT